MCSFAKACTLRRVSCFISGLSFNALEAVEVETPANFASFANVNFVSELKLFSSLFFSNYTEKYLKSLCSTQGILSSCISS
ncbi:hypothetical protein ALTER154_100240 [Alteromonas sp. 154]|nr:hypothetical protein ALTER154_100240 [Alteromonas sp. 154]